MFRRNQVIAILLILLLENTIPTYSQSIKLDPKVRTGKLANGFTYYIRHNTEPKKRVVLYLANKIGSIVETDEQQGLAHFVEHMSFNGTTHFPKNQLIDYLQKSGVRFGADINAYTSFDETVYQLPLPTDDPEVLKNGIQILRDWAQEALITGRCSDIAPLPLPHCPKRRPCQVICCICTNLFCHTNPEAGNH